MTRIAVRAPTHDVVPPTTAPTGVPVSPHHPSVLTWRRASGSHEAP